MRSTPGATATPRRFGGIDPGASAIKDVAANLLGIPIDYFVLVDMTGFAEMVDVMGGVTVAVREDLVAPVYNRDDGTHVMATIPAGSQLLDGDLALAYARSRTGSNDYRADGAATMRPDRTGGTDRPIYSAPPTGWHLGRW